MNDIKYITKENLKNDKNLNYLVNNKSRVVTFSKIKNYNTKLLIRYINLYTKYEYKLFKGEKLSNLINFELKLYEKMDSYSMHNEIELRIDAMLAAYYKNINGMTYDKKKYIMSNKSELEYANKLIEERNIIISNLYVSDLKTGKRKILKDK